MKWHYPLQKQLDTKTQQDFLFVFIRKSILFSYTESVDELFTNQEPTLDMSFLTIEAKELEIVK